MWFKLVCLLLVFSASQGWEVEKKYEYLIGSKIFQDGKLIKNIAAGIFQFKWDSQHLLTGRFRPKYSGDKINLNDYLAIPKDTFQVAFKAGQVTDLKVPEDTSTWKVEFIRGMMGLLQVSDLTQDRDEFSIMEESVTGKCKTYYSVTRQEEESTIQIVKTKNYTDCEKTPVFERGVFGTNNYDVLMKKRDLIARNTRAGFIMNEAGEIQEANIREGIQVISEGSTIEFSTEIGLWQDAKEVKKIKEKQDDDEFLVGDLISVGGLMYRPKPQKRFCDKQMSLQRNEIDATCETDYYMNPKQFDTAYDGREASVAKMLVEQIAQELKTPSEIPKTNTLDRFTVLVGVARYMSSAQLGKVARFWDKGGSESFIFQSAMVQAGTLEALEAIRTLKKNDEFNTDLVDIGVLPEKVHPLSLNYLESMFDFATDPELMEKDFDFSKDLFLAFSNLLRRYSTEKEKPFKQEQLNKLILSKYRKYLSNKLQSAIDSKDKLKFQVYVKALGNMADLSFFNYYLTHSFDKLTPFQKTFMVNSMDNTVTLYPEKSRVMLMKLYKNTDEDFSVRTAAVYQLFKTNLPEDMVLDIIRIAKESENGHIQSAVKSTVLIEDYEYYKNERINEMAESIVISTIKEDTSDSSRRWSESRFNFIPDKVENESTLIEIINGMNEDPLSILGYFRYDRKGFKSSVKFAGIIDYFANYVRGFSSPMASYYDRLRIKTSSANIEIDKDFRQTFLPFVNLRANPMDIMRLFEEDKTFNFAVLDMIDEVVIGFPTESGLPFLYTYQSPIVEDFEMATHIGSTFKVDFNLVLSMRGQTKMGFANPTTGKHYVHGIDVNTQINIPLSISYQSYGSNHIVTIDPLIREGNQRLIHLATWPYTGIRDLFPVEPVAEDEDTVNIQSENLFKGEEYFDDTERLRVKLISTEIGQDGNMADYVDSKEIERYTYLGPFGEVKPTYNLFNLFFKEDQNNPTSFIVKVDLSSNKMYMSQQTENAGSITGPFFFMGRSLVTADVELTGQTNRSGSMELVQQSDLLSNTMKIGWTGSYSENDTKVFESCLDTYIEEKRQSYYFSSDENKTSNLIVFSKLRFGDTCKDGSFISGEAEIDTNNLEQKSDWNLTVTVDFDGFCDEVAKEICQFEGDTYRRETAAVHMKVVQKNPEKCDALTKIPEEVVTEKFTGEPDADAEILDMLAAERFEN